MTADRDYLTCAETAKLVRAALKREFPGVKFSVRSDTYSMGASIDVHWIDGPTTRQVEAIAKQYEGADFDGMIDLKTYSEHWLNLDGTVTLAHAEGTVGSRGVIPTVDNPVRPAGARRVHFGADFIHCTRSVSPALIDRAKAYAQAHPITDYHLNPGEIRVYVTDEDRTDPHHAQSYAGDPDSAYRWLASQFPA